jgi:hypothetical protein
MQQSVQQVAQQLCDYARSHHPNRDMRHFTHESSLSSGRGCCWHGIANINARKSGSAARISGKFSWALPPSGYFLEQSQ